MYIKEYTSKSVLYYAVLLCTIPIQTVRMGNTAESGMGNSWGEPAPLITKLQKVKNKTKQLHQVTNARAFRQAALRNPPAIWSVERQPCPLLSFPHTLYI